MRLTGNAGVRIVNTRQNANGYRTAATTGEFEPIDIDRKYGAILPSINLALRITPDLVVRAAYSEVMSKPSFLDLSPTRTLDYDTFEGSGGNPELMPYQANQYDAAIEYYFGRPGFVYLGYPTVKPIRAKHTPATDLTRWLGWSDEAVLIGS